MYVKATIIEMVIDNYQGASGLPIKRDVLIELRDDVLAKNVLNEVVHAITAQYIKGSLNSKESFFPYQNVLSIEMLIECPQT